MIFIKYSTNSILVYIFIYIVSGRVAYGITIITQFSAIFTMSK